MLFIPKKAANLFLIDFISSSPYSSHRPSSPSSSFSNDSTHPNIEDPVSYGGHIATEVGIQGPDEGAGGGKRQLSGTEFTTSLVIRLRSREQFSPRISLLSASDEAVRRKKQAWDDSEEAN